MSNENDIKGRIYSKINKFERELSPQFPKNILIEVSNICNHKCLFCANSKMTRKKGEIESETLKRILNEAYDLGTREVGFYATGEPLISQNLESYIKYAKEIGYEYVYITTNGALFNESRIKSIIDSGIDSIKISINAGTRKTYKLIHGEDNFEEVIRNINYIDNYRKLKNINMKLYISYVMTKQNKLELDILKEMVDEVIDDIVSVNSRNQGGIMYEMNEYMCLEGTEYGKKVGMCSLPFNSFTVTYEGYLSSCCVDFQNYLTIADLNKIGLKEAWHSDKFKLFRKQHLENKLEGTLCYNCVNNTTECVQPLTSNHASKFYYKDFDKTEEIVGKLEKY